MTWPLPSLRPSMDIDTLEAWPVTTTWKASNSFFAAEIDALVGAPAGGCVAGRTLTAAGVVQTVAADAALAMVQVAMSVRSDFMWGLLGCLVPGTAGVRVPGGKPRGPAPTSKAGVRRQGETRASIGTPGPHFPEQSTSAHVPTRMEHI